MTNNIQLHKKNLYIVALTSIIIANPVVFFLLFNNLFVIITCLLLVFLILFVLFFYIKSKIPFFVFLNLFVSISIIFSFEVIFKFVFSEYNIENWYIIKGKYYFNKSYLNRTINDKEYSCKYLTNQQGFRIGSRNNPNIYLDKCDWLFLGDSYTQGAQVDFEFLYSSILYKYFPNKIIINAGISGFGIGEEYNYYINEGKKLQANKVFLQICNFNDFYNVGEYERDLTDYLMEYSDLARFFLYNLKYTQPSELPLGRWTEPFYSSIDDNIDYNIFYKKKSQKKIEDLNNFYTILEKFNIEVRKNRSELILIVIPTKEQIYYKYLNEVIEGYKLNIKELDMDYPNHFLDSCAQKLNIKVIDLKPSFENNPKQLFFDYDEHLNLEGHKEIAQSVSNWLIANGENTRYKLLHSFFAGDRYPRANKNKVFFQSICDGNYELFSADKKFDNIVRLTYNDIDESHPVPSPNGKFIAFTEGDIGTNQTKVVLMNLESQTREYILPDNYFCSIPAFSNDGNLIALCAWNYNKGSMTNSNIVLKNLVTNKFYYIIKNNFENWRPVFSKDDKELIFISDKEGNYDIFQFDMVNNIETQITNSSYDEWDPFPSMDKSKIIYSAKVEGNWDLFEYYFKEQKNIRLTKSLGNEWDASYLNDEIIFAGEFGLFGGLLMFK